MSSILQKATPFFEHIVIGLAYAAIGYSFFWTFNLSPVLSIFGMVAVCFGGLKLLVGVIIYSGWIFALIFRPDYLKKRELEEEEAARKAPVEGPIQQGWFHQNLPFIAKHWGTLLELTILLIGFLVIVITRN